MSNDSESKFGIPTAAVVALASAFAGSSHAQLDFRTPIFEDLTRIGIPQDAATGDLDGDGFEDLVIALAHPVAPDEIPGRLLVLNSRGLLANPTDLFEFRLNSFVTSDFITQRPSAVELSDYDGDGLLDIVVVSAGVPGDQVADPLTILLNSGDNATGFVPALEVSIGIGDQPVDLAVEDFDGDEDEDFVVLLAGDGSLVLARNVVGEDDGRGGERNTIEQPEPEEPEELPGLIDPTTIEPGDFDNAAVPTVLAIGMTNEVRVVRGLGTDQIEQISVGLPSEPSDAEAANVIDEPLARRVGPTPRGEARVSLDEFIVPLPESSTFIVFSSDGEGGFIGEEFLVDPNEGDAIPSDVESADLDNDGQTDLAFLVDVFEFDGRTEDVESRRVIRLFRNETDEQTGELIFGEPVDIEPDTVPTLLLVTDLNNDGLPDFVTVNENEVDLTGPPDVTSVIANPDPSNPSCGADLNFDGVVNINDIVILLQFFGQESLGGDANGDGFTDLLDLVLVLELFGTACGSD